MTPIFPVGVTLFHADRLDDVSSMLSKPFCVRLEKRRRLSTKLHDVTYQKIVVFRVVIVFKTIRKTRGFQA